MHIFGRVVDRLTGVGVIARGCACAVLVVLAVCTVIMWKSIGSYAPMIVTPSTSSAQAQRILSEQYGIHTLGRVLAVGNSPRPIGIKLYETATADTARMMKAVPGLRPASRDVPDPSTAIVTFDVSAKPQDMDRVMNSLRAADTKLSWQYMSPAELESVRAKPVRQVVARVVAFSVACCAAGMILLMGLWPGLYASLVAGLCAYGAIGVCLLLSRTCNDCAALASPYAVTSAVLASLVVNASIVVVARSLTDSAQQAEDQSHLITFPMIATAGLLPLLLISVPVIRFAFIAAGIAICVTTVSTLIMVAERAMSRREETLWSYVSSATRVQQVVVALGCMVTLSASAYALAHVHEARALRLGSESFGLIADRVRARAAPSVVQSGSIGELAPGFIVAEGGNGVPSLPMGIEQEVDCETKVCDYSKLPKVDPALYHDVVPQREAALEQLAQRLRNNLDVRSVRSSGGQSNSSWRDDAKYSSFEFSLTTDAAIGSLGPRVLRSVISTDIPETRFPKSVSVFAGGWSAIQIDALAHVRGRLWWTMLLSVLVMMAMAVGVYGDVIRVAINVLLSVVGAVAACAVFAGMWMRWAGTVDWTLLGPQLDIMAIGLILTMFTLIVAMSVSTSSDRASLDRRTPAMFVLLMSLASVMLRLAPEAGLRHAALVIPLMGACSWAMTCVYREVDSWIRSRS
mgnify:CR=1 FL=1